MNAITGLECFENKKLLAAWRAWVADEVAMGFTINSLRTSSALCVKLSLWEERDGDDDTAIPLTNLGAANTIVDGINRRHAAGKLVGRIVANEGNGVFRLNFFKAGNDGK